MNDVELVLAAQRGDPRASAQVVHRFYGLVVSLANERFLPGADRDDVKQEAFAGLWRAVKTFDPAKCNGTVASFIAFCVRRHLITAVVAARRQKHLVLNERVIGEVVGVDGDALDLFETIPDVRGDAIDQLAARDKFRALIREVGGLTDLERAALVGVHFEGRTYAEIGGGGTARDKRVDNALQRAILKLRERMAMPVPPTMLQAAA